MWKVFFLIPRKYLEFFLFSSVNVWKHHSEVQRILPSYPSLLIMNTFISPHILSSYRNSSPVHSASLIPVNHFSIALKLWNLTLLQHCSVHCDCFHSLLPVVWRGFVGLSFPAPLSSRPLPAEPTLPASLSAVGLWQTSSARCRCHDFRYSCSQLSILQFCWKLLSAYRDERGACVCTWATYIHTAC